MKLKVEEWNKCFSFQLTAETVEDAALLVRCGVNARKVVLYAGTAAHLNGTIEWSLSLAKRKDASAYLKNRGEP
jgi:hypothetical protein